MYSNCSNTNSSNNNHNNNNSNSSSSSTTTNNDNNNESLAVEQGARRGGPQAVGLAVREALGLARTSPAPLSGADIPRACVYACVYISIHIYIYA